MQERLFNLRSERAISTSSILESWGLRFCPGDCGAILEEGEEDHSPDECVVWEVMFS